MNLLTLLEEAADSGRERIAVGSLDDGLSYSRLLDCVRVAAARFAASPADHVVLCDESSPAVPIALFAAAAAGMPYVPLNYRLSDGELRHLAARAGPAVVVADAANAARLERIDGLEVVERAAFLDWFAFLDRSGDADGPRREDDADAAAVGHAGGSACTVGHADGSACTGEAADSGQEPHTTGDDIALLLFTSGTSGEPKTALLRHRHLVSYIGGSVEFMGAGDDEAAIVSVPPYHIAGVAAVLSSVYAGRRIVLLPRFDADDWIDTVERQGITHAMVVPTMLARIVETLDARGGEPMLSPRILSYGGGRMPLPVIRRALELFPISGFVNAYGLTETSSTIALLGPDEHRLAQFSEDPAAQQRLGSVGRVLPGVEVSIRDDRGNELPAGTPGEVFVRGRQVSGEYLDEGSKLVDGWFCTHDGGYLDDDGYLVVTGRNDDVIIRGGENMSPGEIENAVLTHPGVRDAAAIGVPSTQWGEKVVLAVVPAAGTALDPDGTAAADPDDPSPLGSGSAPGSSEQAAAMIHDPSATGSPVAPAARKLAADLKYLVRERLRSSRVPEHIVFCAELPYNETGKLLRRVLREQYASLGDSG